MDKTALITALQNMSPEQLEGILAQGNGRSPIKPRQLHDLRLMPTATDPRPLFIPSAEANRDMPERHTPYPKLLWHVETGQEITVYDEAEHQAKGEMWTNIPPASQALDPVARAKQMFDALSPEDQALVLEQQRQARIAAVTAAMGGLTVSQAAEALGEPAPVRKARKSA